MISSTTNMPYKYKTLKIATTRTRGLAQIIKTIRPELEELRPKIMKPIMNQNRKKHITLFIPSQEKLQTESFKSDNGKTAQNQKQFLMKKKSK